MTAPAQIQNKNSLTLNKKITKLLILNNEDLKPFIEIFEFSGENIIQQPLGRILGIFEIKDESDYSAFIVNFLTSIIKKEYFINPKRDPEESLETSLNKINKALSELANQNNINWMGKLDAAIAVLYENKLYFSATGQAKILIIRNKELIDISDGLASDEASFHPLKTFVDISSGKILDGDTIILTTDDLFHVFSLEQLQRGAKRFDSEKFIQFIKTGLINELPIAGTIIINIAAEEKKPDKIIKTNDFYNNEVKLDKNINYFSQNVFTEKKKEKPLNFPKEEPSEENTAPKQCIDKRTGHIYIKENKHKEAKLDAYSEITSKITARIRNISHPDKFKKNKQSIKNWKKILNNTYKKMLILYKNLLKKIEK